MDSEQIKAALADISADTDPTRKAAKLASLCSELFREQEIELVVVGGSAIEILTEGAYCSGDLDLCLLRPNTIALRTRQELMGKLGAKGGPRSWEVAGMFVDLLGPLETQAKTPLRQVRGPYGLIQIIQPEELLVERLLVSAYPQPYAPARACAKMLAAVSLKGQVQMDWDEVKRLANLPDFDVAAECKNLVQETAHELEIPSPYA